MGHLRTNQLSVDKQLHLNTSPRIGIIYHPPGNTLRPRGSFTPTMKRRRKRVQIDDDCNRPNENRFKYGLRNQEIDETGHTLFALWLKVFISFSPGLSVSQSTAARKPLKRFIDPRCHQTPG